MSVIPPLRLAWSVPRSGLPVVVGPRAVLFTKSGESRCTDVATGRTLWRYSIPNAVCAPELATREGLFVAVRNRGADKAGDGYHVLNPSTGSVIRRLSCKARSGLVPIADLLVGADVAIEAVSAEDGATAWRREEPELGWAPYQFAIARKDLVFGRRNGDVVALDARSGQERWTTTVRDLSWDGPGDPKPGCVFGDITTFEDSVILNVSRYHLVCLSLRDGRRLWHQEGFVDQGCLVGHEYVTAPRGVIDVRTGERLPLPTPRKGFTEAARKFMVGSGTICATETHVFQATRSGYIWAWERSTGDVVWCERPPGALGAFNSGKTFAIHDGRLYYADSNWTVYCFEGGGRQESASEGPTLKKVVAKGETVGAIRMGRGKPSRSQPRKTVDLKAKKPRKAKQR